MTRIGRRLIEDFLLPALNDERYGDLLKWIDRERCYFSIRWSHKNAAKWTLADTAVFQDWDKLKGHYHPEIKGYYMQAKQRFRAALYKLDTVRKLPCEDKHVKKYQLVLDNDKRKGDILAKRLRMARKEENQRSIPTPVICKNTSYIAKPKVEDCHIDPPSSDLPSPPASPASSIKSESCDMKGEFERCLEEYQEAQRKQMMLSNNCKHLRKIVPKKENLLNEQYPLQVLRESPQMNMVRRTPHVPIQPLPVYNGKFNALRQVVDSSQKRVESPHVLLVQTYNDINDVGIKEEVHDSSDELCIAEEENTDSVLNLSVRSEDREMLSR